MKVSRTGILENQSRRVMFTWVGFDSTSINFFDSTGGYALTRGVAGLRGVCNITICRLKQ